MILMISMSNTISINAKLTAFINYRITAHS